DNVLKKLDTLIPLFNQRVEKDFQKIQDHGNTVESIDINEFYSRLKKVFNCFLERPKYWEIANIKMKDEDLLHPMTQMNPDHTCNWTRM
ncbi:MAG: hypothetical protein JSW06_09995, partial [Thermoplasmatales archaeon]